MNSETEDMVNAWINEDYDYVIENVKDDANLAVQVFGKLIENDVGMRSLELYQEMLDD